jgi:L-alanine-DL-glutamate epimerase-like enolase superfamily enzyme
MSGVQAPVESLDVRAFTIPTDQREADGTIVWDSTTVVVVTVRGGGETGVGFTYGPNACATLIHDVLRDDVLGRDALDVPGAWGAMVASIRNVGRPGVASMAISAVDTALWDLKAKVLGVSVARLLGTVRDAAPVYGSGGFTTYSDDRLREQFTHWVHELGIPRVKMKIGQDWGTNEARDLQRVHVARQAIGPGAQLFVDANGAYTRKQAVRMARVMADDDVSYFEEPVSSDDLEGLHLIRGMIDMDVAAGEYGYHLAYFADMCRAGAVDILQADVSRCGGVTEWMRVASVAAGHGLRVSAHTAQSLTAHVACAVPNVVHLEYFHDHARCDRILFDGVLDPVGGVLRPDPDRPGFGLELKLADAERYAA